MWERYLSLAAVCSSLRRFAGKIVWEGVEGTAGDVEGRRRLRRVARCVTRRQEETAGGAQTGPQGLKGVGTEGRRIGMAFSRFSVTGHLRSGPTGRNGGRRTGRPRKEVRVAFSRFSGHT